MDKKNNKKASPESDFDGELLQYIRAHEDPPATLAQIAKALKKRKSTVVKALERLKEKKLVSGGRGRRSRVNPQPNGSGTKQISASFRLYQNLRAKIASGELRTQLPLDKLMATAIEHSVSVNTVRKAYQLLEKDGKLFRKGKKWIVGQPKILGSDSRERQILVIQRNPGSWKHLEHSAAFRSFYREFSHECIRHSVHLKGLTLKEDTLHFFPSQIGGLAALPRYMSQNRDRVLGFLVLKSGRESIPQAKVINSILPFQKPIVQIDTVFVDQEEKLQITPLHKVHQMFVDADRFSQVGVEYAIKMGHRKLAYVDPPGAIESWSRHRLDSIRKHARKISPGTEIITFSDIQKEIHSMAYPAFATYVKKLLTSGSALQRTTLAKLEAVIRTGTVSMPLSKLVQAIVLRKLPSHLVLKNHLLRWVDDYACFWLAGDSTVLMANCDTTALALVRALAQSGASIPRDLSVISWDNSMDSTQLNISSVENGTRELGYRSFHYLRNSFLDTQARQKRVPIEISRPRMVEKGSVQRLIGVDSLP